MIDEPTSYCFRQSFVRRNLPRSPAALDEVNKIYKSSFNLVENSPFFVLAHLKGSFLSHGEWLHVKKLHFLVKTDLCSGCKKLQIVWSCMYGKVQKRENHTYYTGGGAQKMYIFIL